MTEKTKARTAAERMLSESQGRGSPTAAHCSQTHQSKAFEDDYLSFFFFLKEACDQTFEEVVLASERLIKLIENDVRRADSSLDLHYLDDLIRREYAAIADRLERRRRLLDVIDECFSSGSTALIKLSKSMRETKRQFRKAETGTALRFC